MVVQVVLTIRKFFQHFEFTWAEVIVYHSSSDTISFKVINDLFHQQPLTAFFSSIWCYWLPCAFVWLLTGNIIPYSRINRIGGNFFSLYTYTSREEIHFSRVVIVYWVITDRVKKLHAGVTFAQDLLCASFLLQSHLTSNEVLKWTDTSKRKYKFKLLNYFEIHPRYSSKKYFDDLGKYLQLRLRRINRAARRTIYLASSKTFMAKERYGVVSWQEVKKYFFGSTDSDTLSWKRNFPLSFHDAFISHIKIFLRGEVLLLITRRWGVIWNYCEMFIFVSCNTVRTEKINILGIARLKITCKWKRKMVSFGLGIKQVDLNEQFQILLPELKVKFIWIAFVCILYTTNTQEMSEIRVLSKIDRTALTKTLSQASVCACSGKYGNKS